MRTAITSPHIPAPRFRYSPCVRIGPVCQVAGMIGLDPATGKLVEGGPGTETACIFANLLAAMPDYGVTFDDLVIARIFTTRMDEFAAINAAWEAMFGADAVPPARTTVGVSALPLGASVEIEFQFFKHFPGDHHDSH